VRPQHGERVVRAVILAAVLAAILAVAAGCVQTGHSTEHSAGRGNAAEPGSPPAPPSHPGLPIGLPVNPAELDQPALDRAVELARQAGATELQAGVPWWYITREQPPGRYDWQALDRLVDTALAARMRVRLQLSGTPDSVHPQLARTVPDHGARVWYPPRTPAELRTWGVFVGDTVRHFAGRVSSYELWNEPNIHNFWKPGPSPAEYARLLAEGYRSAKRASPAATVMFGGLSRSDVGYLEHFYDEARRLFPDAGQHRFFFDLLDVHPYTDGRSPDEVWPDAVWQGQFGDIDHSFAGLRSMKTVMDDNERNAGTETAGKQILIGEFGYTAGPAHSQPIVPDRRRAYYLKRAVADARQLPFVAGLYWYGFLPDSTTAPGWAIAAEQGQLTWTYLALRDLATGRAPAVRFADPRAVRPGGGPIRPVLTGLPAADVIHTELFLDGVLTAEADGPAVRCTPSCIPSASGQAQLVVYTRDRHAWPSTIVTVGPGPD
jgi:polysaccharide biosynthesis protein PslG